MGGWAALAEKAVKVQFVPINKNRCRCTRTNDSNV